ncbi:DNA polymerase III subunits gamma and tau [hydrothermal vent metagenome]|uniref:DNA-directed DNA polymerase n=1 Tax=hydrothermal vent metagenome TaxID=652676 RepID=A0A3B0U3Z5_9ZZZZ
MLARKYRPNDFAGLIGQEAMVQTLTNAFKTGRIHHAFILTGVRGVGKTTTARILARAFNYADENGAAPSLELGRIGENCQAIIEGRHVDVIEMDAASNTGIDDIREIIDSVKYGPVSAPYKVYIIDEVHMLSRQAFNGLLKTLEEPPPYVKFIFATTEIRKVPVTILSRCQRFDLRRIAPETMLTYLEGLLKKENIEFETEALAMIVRAGEGSVRDCLSLTDQAISHGNAKLEANSVALMLGLADRGRSIDLFATLMAGDIAKTLDLLRDAYDGGVDPLSAIADLADFTHLVTRIKVVPATIDDPSLTPYERNNGKELAQKLGMRVLTRTWQILQGGLEEVAKAANPINAAEMVLVRLAYAADLPTPDELIEKLSAMTPEQGGSLPETGPASRGPGPGPGPQAISAMRATAGAGATVGAGTNRAFAAAQPVATSSSACAPESKAMASPKDFAALVALASQKRDLVVKHALENDIRLISFEAGRIEIALTQKADKSIVSMLSARLKQWTGQTWMVVVSSRETSATTLRQRSDMEKKARFAEARRDPMVKAIMETFTGSELVAVRGRSAIDDQDDTKDTISNSKEEQR